MMPWGQQRWAPLGATANLRCQGVGQVPLPVPMAPSSSRQRVAVHPKGEEWGGRCRSNLGRPPEASLLCPLPGAPGAAPGGVMGAQDWGRELGHPALGPLCRAKKSFT